ncbi:hypothetical protein [Candidatus Nitrosocosmicus hydrocola]|uniref:hypothetical protein n=1 Tax=Candidatus Nitrosocosmicus hydrocola TaxID=1826872 RepID=UPI0011E5DA3D|nr:hypothetical protein [Candidatus Nitrosocosmicus hydrocola]
MSNIKPEIVSESQSLEVPEVLLSPNRIFNQDSEHWKQFWSSLDQNFFHSLKDARRHMYILTAINILLVSIGITFFVNAIWLIWYGEGIGNGENTNQYTGILSGALSIATFVGIFFIKPQNYITKSLANMAQIQLIYKAHLISFLGMTEIYYNKVSNNKNLRIQDIVSLNKELERSSKNFIQMIEKNIDLPKQDESLEEATGNLQDDEIESPKQDESLEEATGNLQDESLEEASRRRVR